MVDRQGKRNLPWWFEWVRIYIRSQIPKDRCRLTSTLLFFFDLSCRVFPKSVNKERKTLFGSAERSVTIGLIRILLALGLGPLTSSFSRKFWAQIPIMSSFFLGASFKSTDIFQIFVKLLDFLKILENYQSILQKNIEYSLNHFDPYFCNNFRNTIFFQFLFFG